MKISIKIKDIICMLFSKCRTLELYLFEKLKHLWPWRSPHIVQFPDGNYAIRKVSFFDVTYRDLKGNFWWGSDSHHSKDCFTKDLEILRNEFSKHTRTKVAGCKEVNINDLY